MTFPFYDYDSDFFSTEDLLFLAGASGSAVEDTATGNPLTFLTDLAKPLKSLVANFLPVQASGTPSPDNILPITGWDAVNVGQINGIVPDISNNSGMEKVNGQWQNASTDGKTRFDAYIQLYKDSTYIKGAGSKSITSSGVYSITFNVDDANCNRIVFLHSGSSNNLSVKFPFELPQGTYTISFNVVSANPSVVGGLIIKDIFLVEGSEVERTVYPASFPSTLFGGYVDMVTGEVWQTWNGINLGSKTYTKRSENQNRQIWEATFNDAQFYGTSAYSAEAKCSQFDLTTSNGSWTVGKFAPAYEGKNRLFIFVFPPNSFSTGAECAEAMNGVQLAYELANPVLITTLTPQQINAIKGNNTVWSDANGDCSVTFLKKG